MNRCWCIWCCARVSTLVVDSKQKAFWLFNSCLENAAILGVDPQTRDECAVAGASDGVNGRSPEVSNGWVENAWNMSTFWLKLCTYKLIINWLGTYSTYDEASFLCRIRCSRAVGSEQHYSFISLSESQNISKPTVMPWGDSMDKAISLTCILKS